MGTLFRSVGSLSVLLLLSTLTLPTAAAETISVDEHGLEKNEFADGKFHPEHWSKGLHIFTGFGLNTTSYRIRSLEESYGVGSNLKSDVGYYLSDDWAIESSASINFNGAEEDLLWGTMLTLGVRYRFQGPFSDHAADYARVFAGRSITVLFPDRPFPPRFIPDSRIHFEGSVFGLSYGHLNRNESGRVWFIEGNISVETITDRDDIVMDGEVPVVVSTDSLSDPFAVYSFTLSVGILLF